MFYIGSNLPTDPVYDDPYNDFAGSNVGAARVVLMKSYTTKQLIHAAAS